ncbi:SPW repeat protein [Thermopolyspora sp. NPDC052614]|uniref:SPW repeat protein n=1 Tax=Thermopolyspora sp. NPDC052614 TaxID=3155682 RepID=UPI003427F31E
MRQHPDIVEMRERYDLAASQPTMQVAEGLTLLSGLYLALSPWIVGFTDRQGITINNLVTGLVVAALALGFHSAFGRTHGLAWVLPVLGIWTIIAPWVIRGDQSTTGSIWSNVVVGVLITLLGLAALAAVRSPRR